MLREARIEGGARFGQLGGQAPAIESGAAGQNDDPVFQGEEFRGEAFVSIYRWV